jgi:uncharacterized protein YlaI
MIKHYFVCDVCGKKLPTKTKQTPFGEVEIVCGTGTTKEWNTKGLFMHLCKECALTIDNGLLKTKNELLSMTKSIKKS